MIKAVIFDMDGLLVDSEPLWERTTREVYQKLGVDITDEARAWMMGRRSLENAEYLYGLHAWEGPSPKAVTDNLINEMIKLVNAEGILMPGVHQALTVCKQAGLPVAIASSSPRRLVDAVVAKLEIEDHFDHIYSAEYEEYGKPHPGVFLKVARHLKVAPHDCLVFEDAPSGVLAAKAARMKCVAVPEAAVKDHPFVRTADLIIGSLEEFGQKTLKSL